MPRTRIIIGHPAKTGSVLPHLVYLGTSGSEAESVMKADQTAHHYEIFEGPGRRKNNASYNPAAKSPAAAEIVYSPVVIPHDLKGMKKDELITSLALAGKHIEQLEKELAEIHEANRKAAETLAASAAPLLEKTDSDTDVESTDDLDAS